MPIVTLTTDWNTGDYFTGAFKGKLISRCHDVNIVDISHNISAFNISQAAFILRSSYYHFPPGTIHVIFIKSEPSDECPFLAVKANGHFFIGADNGIFDLMLKQEPEKIIKLTSNEADELKSYSAFDAFTDAACALALGKDISVLGSPLDKVNQRTPLRPVIENNTILGSVIYIDSYMNAISNISEELFERLRAGRKFAIYVQSKHYKISTINRFYHESPAGELLAVFNSLGLLEIAINNGSAANLLNLNINSTIRVEFLSGV